MGIFERKLKIFYRKSKKGNIIKVVREHYLRDDVYCGVQGCIECGQDEQPLNPDLKSSSSLFSYPHLTVIDVDVAINQIDFLCQEPVKNVIVPQTVLQEVKSHSLAIYKSLRDLIESPSKHFYVFTNEHHKDCYIEREADESAKDRNDRAIILTAWWYHQHLINAGHKVIFLTDSYKNVEKSKELEVPAVTTKEYATSFTDHPGLLDMVAEPKVDDGNSENNSGLFPPHMSMQDIKIGIKAGKLHQGVLKTSRNNFLEGNVLIGDEKAVLIKGRFNLNRALNDDVVAVEILPEKEWSAPSNVIIEQEEQEEEKENDEEAEDISDLKKEENMLSESASSAAKQPTGRVVGVIKRKWRQFCGILKKSDLPDSNRHRFIPADKKIPFIRVETRQSDLMINKRIVVAIDSWPRNSKSPKGHIVRVLGIIGDKDTENEVVLLEHDCPHSKFSEAVLNCLPKLPWLITPEDEDMRDDLRHVDICSVDPVGCTDIDDALHCKKLPNGNFEVGVHIADVSHFIRPYTAIDDEARHRSTTVYLTSRRIDMVPDLLSSNLCSLRSNTDRFAFSVIWELSKSGEILSTRFCKSIIHSRAELTYEETQQRIDDPSITDDLTKSLRNLNKIAKKLKAKRLEDGALVLASMEVKFHIDPDSDSVVDIVAKQHLEAMSMVEEFMLLANISAAKTTLKHFPDCALLRRHPSPPQSNFDPLLAAAKSQDVDIDVSSNKSLCSSLEHADRANNPFFNSMLRIMTTRCMMQALYFCSSTQETEEFYHYGLATPFYTHFTSPIRRYADIIVHRLLAVIIEKDKTYPDLLNSKKCADIAQHINYRHKMAQYAGRASAVVTANSVLRGKVSEYDAYVLFLHKNALQVLAPQIGQQFTLYLDAHIRERDQKKKEIARSKRKGIEIDSSMDLESPLPEFIFDDKELVVKCGKIEIRPFDELRVQVSIDQSDIQHEKINCRLVTPYIKGYSVPSISVEKRAPTKEKLAPPKKKKKVK